MIARFQVVDTSRQDYPASDKGPARTVFNLHCFDLDTKAPMRQMPKYRLNEGPETEKYSGGQLNGKQITIAVREMAGTGNPVIRGEILETTK